MAHDHNHDHDHHDHGHSHAPASFGKAFAIGVCLNLGYVVIEASYGIASHSMALLGDAGHNLSDGLGLILAWGASVMTSRGPTARRTYGYKSTTTLAALANAVLLLLATGAIGFEAVHRLFNPEPVQTTVMLWVAAAGVVINGATALLFMSGRKNDLNVRAAFTHMLADALVTVGVIVAALLIMATGWLWLDPVVSLLIGVVILVGTWRLLRESVDLAMDAVPAGIDPAAVRDWLGTLPGVSEVHDLHVWALGTTDTALTAHLVRHDASHDRALLHDVQTGAHERFGIAHATVQLETPEAANGCLLRSDAVV